MPRTSPPHERICSEANATVRPTTDAVGAVPPATSTLDPRLRADVLVEIEWYFQIAEAEMAAPSNFGRLLSSVAPDGSRRTPEDQVEAAHAYRRIRGWLYAMPNNEAGVLQTAFEPHNWPRSVYGRFGDLTGIAVRLSCSPELWPTQRSEQERMDILLARTLARRCGDPQGQGPYLDRLAQRALARLDQALVAYVGVRGRAPCIVPQNLRGDE